MSEKIVHLYHEFYKPDVWRRIGIGFSLCRKRLDRSSLTIYPRRMTCQECSRKYHRRAVTEQENQMTSEETRPVEVEKGISVAKAVEEMSAAELVEAYNKLAQEKGARTIKKFRTLADGRRRMATLVSGRAPAPLEETKEDQPAKIKRLQVTPKKKVAKKRGNKREAKKTRSSSPRRAESFLQESSVIEILDEKNTSRGKTAERWDKLCRSTSKTVGNYLSRIGTTGDLRWWSDRKKIRIKSA